MQSEKFWTYCITASGELISYALMELSALLTILIDLAEPFEQTLVPPSPGYSTKNLVSTELVVPEQMFLKHQKPAYIIGSPIGNNAQVT